MTTIEKPGRQGKGHANAHDPDHEAQQGDEDTQHASPALVRQDRQAHYGLDQAENDQRRRCRAQDRAQGLAIKARAKEVDGRALDERVELAALRVEPNASADIDQSKDHQDHASHPRQR